MNTPSMEHENPFRGFTTENLYLYLRMKQIVHPRTYLLVRRYIFSFEKTDRFGSVSVL